MKTKDTKILYLSTKSSSGILQNGDMKSDIVYDLKNYLMYEDDKTVEYITLSIPSCVLVNSNYIINQYNNTLTIDDITYSFPYGNYTAKLFIDAFPNIVSGFTLSLNTVTSRFTITKTSGGSFTILGTSPISYIMGFSENITATGSYTFSRVCNFLPNATYQLCVANGSIYNGLVLSIDGKVSYSNILCSIPNDSKLNTQIVYSNNTNEFRLNSLSCDFLNIQIRDNNGNLVDFNGIATFFSLQINIYRRQMKIVGQFSDILKNAVTSSFEVYKENEK